MVSPAKAGSWADGFELFHDFGGDVEGRPSGDAPHLPPHQGGEDLPACIPEEDPEDFEDGDDLVGVDTFPLRFAGRFFSGLSFTGFPSRADRTSLTGLAFKRRTADFRWQPVSRVNLSGKARFSFFVAFWQRGLYSLVTACFSFMFNPIRTPSFERLYYNLGNIFNVRHNPFSARLILR
jgi:hypothetical protein